LRPLEHKIISIMKPLLKFVSVIGNGVIGAIRFLFMSIYTGVKFIFVSLYRLVKFIFMSIYKAVRFIVVGVYKIVMAILNMIVAFLNWAVDSIVSLAKLFVYYFKKIFIIPFMPSYKVVFSIYQVIPGLPINRSDSVHEFEKGKGKHAIKFYNDVVNTTREKKIVPSEAVLIKRKKVVAVQQFGPVSEIKKLGQL